MGRGCYPDGFVWMVRIMNRNYEEFNFRYPLTDEQIERITEIIVSTGTTRVIDWRDNQTLWVWLEGKTVEDGEWEE